MKNKLFVLAAVLLMAVSYAYAQSARNATYDLNNKSNFTNVGATGQDVIGNPGYIELRSAVNQSSDTDATNTYYLWVGTRGQLCMASYTTISAYASFPNGSWSTNSRIGSTLTNDMPCTVIGAQS